MGTMTKVLYSEENQRLIAWLKSQREAKGLSMRALAKELERPHTFIGKVEQNERQLGVVEFLHYCTALDASPLEGLAVIDRRFRPKSK